MIVSIGIGTALIIALLMIDFWLHRLMNRALFKLIDRLLSFRPGARYRSQSMPQRYARLRKLRNGGGPR